MKLRKGKHNQEGSLCVVVNVCASEVGGHYSVPCRQFSEQGSGTRKPPVCSGQVKQTHTGLCVPCGITGLCSVSEYNGKRKAERVSCYFLSSTLIFL